MSLFRTKPVDGLVLASKQDGGLKRVLGPANLVSLGIGAIIGTGIFVLTGQAAAMHAGPAIVVSMVLAGIVSALAGLCYAELAAAVPVAGSAYTYAYATLGEFIAWIIGWDLVLEYALGAATVAVGWSGYFVSLLADIGLAFPAVISAAPGTELVAADGTSTTAVFNMPAVLIALLVTALLVRGVRESATFNGVMVLIKIAVILLVIAGGLWFVDADRFSPLVPPNTGSFGEFGWSGVMRGAAVIFFAYIGFDAVSTAAQEARDPRRDMPIGILGSLVICTVLYVTVAWVMVGIVPYQELGGPAPMAVAVDHASAAAKGTALQGLLDVLPYLVKLGILAGLTSTIVVQIMAQPRIFMAMSRDGLLPRWMGRVHPRFGTPHLTTVATGAVVAAAAGLTPIAVLGELVSIGTLFAFVVVSIGVLVLRRTHPELPRPFRTPWSPVVPALSALVSFGLMASLPGATWSRLFVWMTIGFAVYFVYGIRRSNLALDASEKTLS
jgi:APA family basic amino acid/polyamine antiporter